MIADKTEEKGSKAGEMPRDMGGGMYGIHSLIGNFKNKKLNR